MKVKVIIYEQSFAGIDEPLHPGNFEEDEQTVLEMASPVSLKQLRLGIEGSRFQNSRFACVSKNSQWVIMRKENFNDDFVKNNSTLFEDGFHLLHLIAFASSVAGTLSMATLAEQPQHPESSNDQQTQIIHDSGLPSESDENYDRRADDSAPVPGDGSGGFGPRSFPFGPRFGYPLQGGRPFSPEADFADVLGPNPFLHHPRHSHPHRGHPHRGHPHPRPHHPHHHHPRHPYPHRGHPHRYGPGMIKQKRGRKIQALARFIDHVTIPDDSVVVAGETCVKIWKVRNDSLMPWPEYVELLQVGGGVNLFPEGAKAVTVKGGLKPGETQEIRAELRIPKQKGLYHAFFRLRAIDPNNDDSGFKFGQRLWCKAMARLENEEPKPKKSYSSSSSSSSSESSSSSSSESDSDDDDCGKRKEKKTARRIRKANKKRAKKENKLDKKIAKLERQCDKLSDILEKKTNKLTKLRAKKVERNSNAPSIAVAAKALAD